LRIPNAASLPLVAAIALDAGRRESPAMTDAIIARLATQLGAYTSIDGVQGHYTAYFEKGADEVLVHLDAAGRIDGLFFRPPKSLDDALRRLRPASGTLSYVRLRISCP
jgi:hypothetical protein